MQNQIWAYSAVLKIILTCGVLMLFCLTPVSASSISVTVSGDINDIALVSGSTTQDNSVYLTVTTDSNNWYISAKDAMEDNKPSGSAGRLSEYNLTSTSYITSSPKVFGTAMGINGTATGSITRTNITELTASEQTLETGTETVTGQILPITFNQLVTYTDARLTNNHDYRISVVFTGVTLP